MLAHHLQKQLNEAMTTSTEKTVFEGMKEKNVSTESTQTTPIDDTTHEQVKILYSDCCQKK